MKKNFKTISYILLLALVLSLMSCTAEKKLDDAEDTVGAVGKSNAQDEVEDVIESEKIYVDFSAPYATYSIINDGYAVLYKHVSDVPHKKNRTVAINAGHGTKNGSKIKTFSHPDFSPKVSGGTNAMGSILSSAISDGTVLLNGMTEANANLLVAIAAKEKLLAEGYDVLMIRENDDSRLDNIARTVIANENADCHIALHFDSTVTDKGTFYITPFNDETYLNMEPLKSNSWRIYKLGGAMIEAFKERGIKVWKDKGTLQGDLTQLSYSTNASIDLELGDKATDITEETIGLYANGIVAGVNKYFANINK